jgi:glucokinase
VQHLVYVTVSTGIGAGLIVDGRPVTGAHGGAGEVGHMIVQPGGPACAAGCPGCLEGVASGTAIAAEAARRLEAVQAAGFGASARPTAADVFRAAAQGDATSTAIIRGVVRHLGAGLASLLAIFDPERLVVGGGVARGLERHWDDLLEAIREHALPR